VVSGGGGGGGVVRCGLCVVESCVLLRGRWIVGWDVIECCSCNPDAVSVLVFVLLASFFLVVCVVVSE
jgi:hypothetical protein